MDDLNRIRQLAGLNEASVANVVTPDDDFYKLPGFRPRYPAPGTEPSNVVDVPYGWDKNPGGGGGGSAAGAQGSTSDGAPATPPASPSMLDKIKDFAKSQTEPNKDDSEPVRDIKKYWKDVIEPPPAKSDSEPAQIDFIDLDNEPGDMDWDKLSKNYPSGAAVQPGTPVIAGPGGIKPSTGDTSLPPIKDKDHITIDPNKISSEINPIVVTPKKKEEPAPEPVRPEPSKMELPTRPNLAQTFGGAIKPKAEPETPPEKEPPKIAAPSMVPISPITPKAEPQKEPPKIAAPSISPIAPVVPTTTAPPAAAQVTPKIPGPSAAPAPLGPSAGSGDRKFGFGPGAGSGQGPGSNLGPGAGPGEGPGAGPGKGPGSGDGDDEGMGQYKGHKWFQWQEGGKAKEVPPDKLPPGWKYIGNGRYVSVHPLEHYPTTGHEPQYPNAPKTYVDRPDWADQYHAPAKRTRESIDDGKYSEDHIMNEELQRLKELSGLAKSTTEAKKASTAAAPAAPPKSIADMEYDQSPLGALRQYDAAKAAGTLPPVSKAPSSPASNSGGTPPVRVVPTKGGDYPVYPKSSPEASSFRDAFAQARAAQGPGGSFEWQGRKYSTNRADDKPSAPAVRPITSPNVSDVPRSKADPAGQPTQPYAIGPSSGPTSRFGDPSSAPYGQLPPHPMNRSGAQPAPEVDNRPISFNPTAPTPKTDTDGDSISSVTPVGHTMPAQPYRIDPNYSGNTKFKSDYFSGWDQRLSETYRKAFEDAMDSSDPNKKTQKKRVAPIR